eukprot:2703728-Pleurochrysis_carterae.AAC.1
MQIAISSPPRIDVWDLVNRARYSAPRLQNDVAQTEAERACQRTEEEPERANSVRNKRQRSHVCELGLPAVCNPASLHQILRRRRWPGGHKNRLLGVHQK